MVGMFADSEVCTTVVLILYCFAVISMRDIQKVCSLTEPLQVYVYTALIPVFLQSTDFVVEI